MTPEGRRAGPRDKSFPHIEVEGLARQLEAFLSELKDLSDQLTALGVASEAARLETIVIGLHSQLGWVEARLSLAEGRSSDCDEQIRVLQEERQGERLGRQRAEAELAAIYRTRTLRYTASSRVLYGAARRILAPRLGSLRAVLQRLARAK